MILAFIYAQNKLYDQSIFIFMLINDDKFLCNRKYALIYCYSILRNIYKKKKHK